MNRNEVPAELNDLSRRIIGCAIEVHNELGPGLLESVYEAALRHELEDSGIPHQHQSSFVGQYKGRQLPPQRIDLLVGNQIIVSSSSSRPCRRSTNRTSPSSSHTSA